MPPMKRLALVLTAAIAPALLIASGAAREHLNPRVVSIYTQTAIAHDVSAPLADTNADLADRAFVGRTLRSAETSAVMQGQRGGPIVPPVITVPAGADQIEQKAAGTKPAATLVESFDGLGADFQGPQGSGRGGNPSDNSLAVGPNHIMQTVNGRGMAIFTKKGKQFPETGKVLYGPVNVRNVFKGFTGNCEERSSGDVVVRYDQLADRWLVVMPLFSRGAVRPDQAQAGKGGDPAQVSVIGVANQPGPAAKLFEPPPPPPTPPTPPDAARGAGAPGTPPARGQGQRAAPPQGPQGPYSMCYAVSVGSDPFGPYYRYEFLRPLFPDYPRPAVWPDGYYVPTSTSDNRISETVATQKHACVADRARMLKGEPASEQCVIMENVSFLNNADLDGKSLPPNGAPNIMIAAGGRQLDNILEDHLLKVWQFHVDWKDPANTKVTGPQDIEVAPYHFLCGGQLTNCVPQPGTDRRLDAQGDKLMARVVYRKVGNREMLVAVHSVNTSTNGGGVRWYELEVQKDRSLSLRQQGTYLSDGLFRWMASPAIDKNGNIGIGYSYGGSDIFAGQRFTGRLPNDPLGQLTLGETVLAEGAAAQLTQRWEDYTQTAVDPSDDCTIWYVGDYFKKDATTYSSKIGAFRMPGCR